MKRKNIELLHETRMWLAQVIIPVVTGTIVLASNPEVRGNVVEAATNAKNWTTTTINKVLHR